MKKSLGAMAIAIFVACTVGAVPPSWGDDSGAAGFSCVSPPALGNDSTAAGFSFRRPTPFFSPNVSLPPALGNDSTAAGFSFRRPTPFFSPNVSLPPALGNGSTAAGLSFRAAETDFSTNLSSNPAGTQPLDYSAGARGVGSISSGMVYQGFNGAERVSFEQHSSASGRFSFSASYSYQSEFSSP